MIKYNAKTINDWYYGISDLVKVYKGGAVCYYKVSGTPPSPTSQTPCFAVVDNISQYSDTEFEDVFNNADGKWYKLNNLNQYEEYGVYGSGRTITTYEGKLTIDEYTQPSRLPSGYTEVEYIENSSYVANTLSTTRFNVIGDSASGNIYTIIYDMEDDGGSHYMDVFGNNVNITMQKIQQVWADKCIHFKYYGLDVYVESTPLSTKAIIEMDSSGVTVTNITASTSTTNTYGGSLSNVNETHYGVFCFYNTSDRGAHSMVGKIYEIKIESSTHELKNHYIPCYRNSDNKVGLYDIVGGAFYYDESNELTLSAGSSITPTTTTCEFIYSGNSWSNLGEVSGSSIVPQGYTEVEYITSENISSAVTGPYIDTNFTPNQNTRVVLDYQPTVNNQQNRRIFGAGRFNNTSSGNYIWSMEGKLGQSNCKFYYKFDNGGSSWSTTSVVPDSNRHVVDFNKEGKVWLDDTAIVTLPNNTVNCSYHLGIFNEIGTSVVATEFLMGRVYSCKVYDSGTLVRDFVPCKNSSNVVGLYDIVNDVFYSSARNEYQFGAGAETGTLVYPMYYDEMQDPPNNVSFSSMTEAEEYECPWVGMKATIDGDKYIFSGDSISGYEWVYQASRLPRGYTEVEYVENQNNAYINTLFKPNQDTRIIAEMQCVTSTNSVMHFGAGGWDRVDGMWLTYETGINGTLHVAWLGKTTWSTYGKGDYNKHTYDWNKNVLYKDETLVGSSTYGTYQSQNNLAIFANLQGEENEYVGGIYMKGKMYSFKIYDNGILVRDFVPCTRDSDSKAGVYDIVNDVFYGSASSYPLVAGNPI